MATAAAEVAATTTTALTNMGITYLEVDGILALKHEAKVWDPQKDLHPELNGLLDPGEA